MSDLVPFILKQEQKLVREERNGKYVSVIFDGTTNLGEALAIVLCSVGKGWTIEQRLLCLQMLSKSHLQAGQQLLIRSFSFSHRQLARKEFSCY